VVFIIALISATVLSSCDDRDLESRLDSNLSPTYTWNYNGQTFTVHFEFSEETYEYYADQPRDLPYAEYVKQDSEHKYLEDVAAKLYRNIENDHYSDKEIAEYLLAFVQQCIPYKILDDPSYPIETLVRGYGDCKHKSILYSSLLNVFNIPCVLVEIPTHLTVAVDCKCDKTPYCFFHSVNFYYAETTVPGWELGQIPDEFRNVSNEQLSASEQTTSFQRPVTAYGQPEIKPSGERPYRPRPRYPVKQNIARPRKRTPLQYWPGVRYYKPSG
jgi:hypothetical protein